MARHVEAFMDGVKLTDVGAILIQDIEESSAEMDLVYGARLIRAGQDVQALRRKSLKVSITFVIKELKDLARRNQILQAVCRWASGSVLELSNHPGQQLHVHCRAYPALTDVRKYWSELKIELEADEIPFWEDRGAVQTVLMQQASPGSGTLMVPGTALTPVGIRFVPSGGALNSLAVTVSSGNVSKTITLSGLTVGSGSPVDLKVDNQDRFTIFAGSYNLLQYRTVDSADDFTVPAGLVSFSWEASRTGNFTASAKGRWL